eukprot:4130373-Pyramimonas_sp.AAC.1
MHRRVLKYAAALRRYQLPSRLGQQGAQAAGAYGRQLHGVFEHSMVQFRRKLCLSFGPRLSGRCLTTLIDLQAPNRDPAYRFPKDTLKLWIPCWTTQLEIKNDISRTWGPLGHELRI